MENTQLIKAINDSKVEPSTAASLQNAFLPFVTTLAEWSDKSKTLIVTDASQTREMKIAREARLALKDIRVKANKKRVELKEDSTRYGKAVQAVYNLLEGMITPMEEHFGLQERFVEIQEEKRIAAIREVREAEVKEYSEYIPVNLDLGEISEEKFQELLSKAKKLHKAQRDLEEQQERERIEKEQATELERKRLFEENKKLKEQTAKLEVENKSLKNIGMVGAGPAFNFTPIIPETHQNNRASVKPLSHPFHCFLCGFQLEEGKFGSLDCPDCLSTFLPYLDEKDNQCLTHIN